MDEDGALFDSGFDGDGTFRDTPEAGSISLESALRDFGPAAIDDLIPRLRSLAGLLDAAHAAGVVHGALHPNKVFITDESTSLVKGTSSSAPFDSAQGRPYVAPEVTAGAEPTPQSDEFALAAIAYEWMFGRPIDRPAERPVEVRTMPGVDRAALSKAFTRALSPKPGDRFASCAAFCDALTATVVPELPLAAPGPVHDADDIEAVEPFVPESLDAAGEEPDDDFLERPAPNLDDVRIAAEEPNLGARATAPDLDAIDPSAAKREVYLPNWNPSATQASRSSESPRFGGMALILATLVGSVFGFAAGYMARPRALQTQAPQEIRTVPATEAPKTAANPGATSATGAPAAKGAAPAEAPAKSAAAAPVAPRKAPEPANVGRLLVRSTPNGATVSVDGVEKGVTPLALRDLEIGTRTITVARRGYIAESQKVSLTKERPSRTLDVRLTASASAPGATAPPRPTTPASTSKPAATTGSIDVDSRPTGAAVTINGKPSGTTPVTITDLPPGEYRVTMSKAGFRNFATTVRVVAGERVRAAYSLTAQEQE